VFHRVLKKIEKTGQLEDKRSFRPNKLSTADEKYLKMMSVKNREKNLLGPDAGPKKCIWLFS